jgi:hypothetical protein
VTIVDNDFSGPGASFANMFTAVDETAGTVQLEVVVSPAPTEPVSVDVALGVTNATQGSDFNFTPETLTFDASTTSQLVGIEILDDAELELGEFIVLELVNPQGMGIRDPGSNQIDIADDESARIDDALLAIDMSGCQPRLVGQAGAVTAGVTGIDIDIQVRDRNYSSTWTAPTFSIEGGEPFSITLETLDLGSRVQVEAQATAGGTTDYNTPYPRIADAPPTIVPGELVVTPIGPDLFLSLTTNAISDRLEEVRLRLVNSTAGTDSTVVDPCVDPLADNSIAAAPTDQVELEVCHGVLLELCSSAVIWDGDGT